ncbi:pilus assembly protein [Brevundimonas goettingensis]|uniref:Pilus assembly protein n=2 Tax=Brevundimonas goettingensis TaxID=2774190 RepID=A0A975GUU9_9CAUL|nr:pilus assembly protein [Brevundimonas goettingensis]
MGVGNWIRRQGQAARTFVQRFGQSTRGNVAMIFAISLPVLVMITMGGVDINRAATVRVNLQDALDAATLAAARSSATSTADLTTIGTKALKANLQNYPDINLANATFTLSADQIVIANATVNVKTLVANIVLPPYGKLLDDTLPVGAHSEVNRSSKNIEVGLVLDITGSMAGQRIADLKTAAAQLVDIVVQAQQTPYYTRMAIVPYSIGVNMGSYAAGARGTPATNVSISGAAWSTGTAKTITGFSNASPGVITSSAHGFSTGDFVWVTGLASGSGSGTRFTTLNDQAYVVTKINNNTFSLKTSSGSAVNTSSSWRSWASGGTVTKCLVSDCSIVVTANGHGLQATTTDTGDTRPTTVYLTDVSGLTNGGNSLVNNQGFEIDNVTTNTFSIGVNGANYSAYSSGGKAWCGMDGCQYRVFRNDNGGTLTTFQTSTCVSERTGSQKYTDASPASYKVGRNYASTNNPCPSATIQPLTDNKTTLKNLISGLTVTGSTAGQIGLAWGWYTVSPNFNSLWSSNPAGANVPRDTLKAVILMTDGDFNSPYCTGVLAGDSGSGSGSTADHINCNATNGDPFTQAAALCTAIKAQNIVVYTVGFAVTAGSDAAEILKDCATSPDYAFLPASGADLTDDFAAIGRDITRLRISK